MMTTLVRTQEAEIIVLLRKILRSAVTILLPAGFDWMNLDATVKRKWLKRENMKTTSKFIEVVFILKPVSNYELIKSLAFSQFMREKQGERLPVYLINII